MYIDNLVIETTRRCNLKCDHCLRGKGENIDFNIEHLIDFIHSLKVESINSITLTGGEPSMVPNVLKEIRYTLQHEEIDVQNFYMATNGHGNNNSTFIVELLEWYCFCTDNEMSRVDVSNDNYHDYEQGSIELGLLKGLSFAGFKHEELFNYTYESTINEGNANEYGIGSRVNTPDIFEIEEDYIGEDYIGEGTLYLNCEGNVFSCCDLSYETMSDTENNEFFITSAANIDLSSIYEYNERLEEVKAA